MKNLPLIFFAIVLFTFCSHKKNEQIYISSHKSIDSTVTLRGVFAVDENTAYVSGNKGAFYKTINGGDSWGKIEILDAAGVDFRDVHVMSDGSIFLMSVGMNTDSKIFKSTDDGKTWNVVFTNQYEQGFLNSIAFWNDNDGIAVGDPVDGRPFVIITKDGGETWNEIDKNNIPAALPGEAGFAASGTCVSVYGAGYAWLGMGGPEARIFRTTDMGKTWTVHSTPILSGENTTGIYSVFFEDEMKGFVLGGDYTKETGIERTIASTTDGGIIWQLVESDSICFQSCIAKLVKEEKEIFISTGPAGTCYSNNGNEFNKLSGTGFHCLSACADNKVIWAAGSKGRVAKISL